MILDNKDLSYGSAEAILGEATQWALEDEL
jgi:hypothetical protein